MKSTKEFANIETENEYDLRLKIHEGFVITRHGVNTYINGKVYYDIEDQDLKDTYIDFINNDTKIFVQFKKRNLFKIGFHLFDEHGYFLELAKNESNIERYSKKKNVEMIFDNKTVLYDSKHK